MAEFIHIKNLEKFHPGYKDRILVWGKVYFNMVQGDPDMEMIKDEVDRWRFVAMICLELQSKKPLPNRDDYWGLKFNIKKRPMSKTLLVLQNFIETITEGSGMAHIEESRVDRVEENREEKSRVHPTGGRDEILSLIESDPKVSVALAEWVKYRSEKKKPVSAFQLRKQIEFLKQQADPVECINQSIRNGWQGLFEVKTNGKTQPTIRPTFKQPCQYCHQDFEPGKLVGHELTCPKAPKPAAPDSEVVKHALDGIRGLTSALSVEPTKGERER